MKPYEIKQLLKTAKTRVEVEEIRRHILGGELMMPREFTMTISQHLHLCCDMMKKFIACRTHRGICRLETAFVQLHNTPTNAMYWTIDNLVSVQRMERFRETEFGKAFSRLAKLTPLQMLAYAEQHATNR